MPYIHFTEEQKQRANSMDLEEFLLQSGERLLPSGREKRMASYHSVTICGSEWYDHAAQRGGGPVAFLQHFHHSLESGLKLSLQKGRRILRHQRQIRQ